MQANRVSSSLSLARCKMTRQTRVERSSAIRERLLFNIVFSIKKKQPTFTNRCQYGSGKCLCWGFWLWRSSLGSPHCSNTLSSFQSSQTCSKIPQASYALIILALPLSAFWSFAPAVLSTGAFANEQGFEPMDQPELKKMARMNGSVLRHH